MHWFCHTSTWIRHGCTCIPHPDAPSHLPPHRFFILEQSYGHSKIEQKAWSSHLLPPPHMSNLPHYQHPHQSGTFVPISESILALCNHPKCIIYLEVHSWCLTSYLDKCPVTCIHHINVVVSDRAVSLPWRYPVLHLFIPPSHKPGANTDLFTALQFCIFGMPCSWNSISFWWIWKLMPRDVCGNMVENLSLRTPGPTLPPWTTACALPQLWWPQTRIEYN